MRFLFKGIFLLILALVVIHSGFHLVYSTMRRTSLYLCDDLFTWDANNFMAKYGDTNFGFDLIHFFRDKNDPDLCEETNHKDTFRMLFLKYPEMREAYYGAIVQSILDSKTKNFNRIHLIFLLQKNTGIRFSCRQDDDVTEYDNLKPYTQKGIQDVADWWTKRLRKKAAASIAATEKDYKFPPPPSQRGR